MDAPDAQLCVSEEKGETWIRYDAQSYRIPVDQIKLLGQHNYFDIGVVYAVCRILGMDEELFTQGLKTYEPLPHRLQYLGERDGVKYYDDSISTICDTTIQALKTLGKEHVDEKTIRVLSRRLNEDEKAALLAEGAEATDWIYTVIKEICKGEREND